MSDRPIILKDIEIRGLRHGKMQLRRLAWGGHGMRWDCEECGPAKPTIWQSVKPGDRLWCQEGWAVPPDLNDLSPREIWSPDQMPMGGVVASTVYKEDYPSWFPWPGTKWRQAQHMLRWASRYTLLITAVKRERVQEISEEDAIAEGSQIPLAELKPSAQKAAWSERQAFSHIWQSLHTKPGWRWEDNPEVVVLEFTVHQRNIDAMERAA